MKLKIPPALVAFLFGSLMWGVHYFINFETLVFSISKWVHRLVFGIGFTVGVAGLYQFIRYRTTIDPHNIEKTTTLVTGGIYRFSRNPMYLALLICLIGFGLKLGNGLSFMIIPLFVLYMNRFQIKPEERVLEGKFGDAYADYASHVRRWI